MFMFVLEFDDELQLVLTAVFHWQASAVVPELAVAVAGDVEDREEPGGGIRTVNIWGGEGVDYLLVS